MSGGATRSERAELLGRPDLTGAALRRALSDCADTWLAGLLGDPGPGIALVAVGGYGRSELSPGSDLDLVLLHDGRDDVAAIAEKVWYPVWDSGVALDHSVRTVDEALAVAADDLKAALGLLHARHLAGDATLSARLIADARTAWRARTVTRLPELHAALLARHAEHGELAFLLEPDLKEARGGLRDLHALSALALAQVADPPRDAVRAAGELLLDVRDALHRRLGAARGRTSDVLVLQEQDGVAHDLGRADAESLMHDVAVASRLLAHASDQTWRRVLRGLAPPPRRRLGLTGRRPAPGPTRTPLATGVVEQDGEVVLARDADPAADPVLVLRAAAAAARAGLPLGPVTLTRLAAGAPMPQPWPVAAREQLVALLGAGPAFIPVWEALDQAGVIVALLPEWEPVRSRPQRNAFHRFTVDRHLLETVAQAASRTRQVHRPDLLLLGALLHDIGKGRPGDHTEVGIVLAEEICPRLGLDADDGATVVTLVRHHLLLADTAARRDPDDPATIATVAEAVGDTGTLALLHALAESDSIATGTSMWSPWKAGVLADLVRRTEHVLAGRPVPPPPPLTPVEQRLLDASGLQLDVAPTTDDVDVVTVAVGDSPSLLASVAGVLALHRLEVRAVTARVVQRRALLSLQVAQRYGTPDWALVREDLRRALDGSLDVPTRLAAREAAYPASRASLLVAPPTVRVLDDVAATATVVELRAHDVSGLLHRATAALAGCGLVLASARVTTLGAEAVDSFYVLEGDGSRISDPTRQDEVGAAVLAAVTGPPAAGR